MAAGLGVGSTSVPQTGAVRSDRGVLQELRCGAVWCHGPTEVQIGAFERCDAPMFGSRCAAGAQFVEAALHPVDVGEGPIEHGCERSEKPVIGDQAVSSGHRTSEGATGTSWNIAGANKADFSVSYTCWLPRPANQGRSWVWVGLACCPNPNRRAASFSSACSEAHIGWAQRGPTGSGSCVG